MKSNWINRQLGDLISIQRGHDLPSQQRKNGSVPIMGSAGITGYHNKAKSSGPGVVIGRSGNSMGEVSFTLDDFWPLNTCLYVTDFKGNDERYIYYLLKTINFDIFNSGSAQKSLNRNLIYPHEVKITESKEEQKRIGIILSDLEKKINSNNQITQTLEEMAQAIFKSWFVDFLPVKAKIAAKTAGRDPERAAMRVLSGKSAAAFEQLSAEQKKSLAATAALFPDEMQDSELGEVPVGWDVKPFSKLAKLETSSVKPYEEPDKVWEHYSIPAFDENKYPVFEKGSNIKSNKYKVYPNAILSSKLNPRFERTWLPILINPEKSICSTEFMQFIPYNSKHLSFVYNLVVSHQFQNGIMQRVTGSTGSRQRAHPKSVHEMNIIYPKIDLIEEFSNKTNDFISIIKNNIKQNKLLENLRDTLLPKLLSGEIELENLEIQND